MSELKISSENEYRTIKTLRKEGITEIFIADDILNDRRVALKRLREQLWDDKEMIHRFLRSAQLTARLQHPHIEPIYLYGSDHNSPFSVGPAITGDTLADILSKLKAGDAATQQAFPLFRLMEIFQAACRTISYAHSYDVLHRDLTPKNILIGEYGGMFIIGWDFAKDLKDRSGNAYKMNFEMEEDGNDTGQGFESGFQTMVGSAIGTPGLTAPELAAGDLDSVDEKTDIYGLGTILYRILTLHSTEEAIRAKSTSGEGIPSPNSFQKKKLFGGMVGPTHAPKGFPTDVGVACMRALEIKPQNRQTSVDAFLNEVLRALS